MTAINQKNSFYPTEIHFTYEGVKQTLDLPSDVKVAQNIKALFDRERGAFFRVNEEGLFKKLHWRSWVAYKAHEGVERAKVQRLMNETLSALNFYLASYKDE